MAEGRDISNWQGALPAGWFAQYDFVIVAYKNERGGLNQFFDAQMRAGAGQCRFGLGVYGWAIRGADNFALGAELGQVANGRPDVRLGCWDDHEIGGRAAMPTPGDIEDYVRGFESVGQKGGYYSNRSDYVSTPFLDARPQWAADPSGLAWPRTPLLVQYGTPGGVDGDRADDNALTVFEGATPKRKKGTSVYQVASAQSQRVWKFDNATKNVVALLAAGPDHDEVLTRAAGGIPTYTVANDLLVVVEAADALKQQGRPASDINSIDFN